MKQSWKSIKDLAYTAGLSASKLSITEYIDSHYSELGIPKDRVKFMKNKWCAILENGTVGYDAKSERSLKVVVSPEKMQEYTQYTCKQLGASVATYNNIWAANRAVCRYLRGTSLGSIDRYDFTNMGVSLYTYSDYTVIDYKGISIAISDSQTNIYLNDTDMEDDGSIKGVVKYMESLNGVTNLDRVMIGVLGILCTLKVITDTVGNALVRVQNARTLNFDLDTKRIEEIKHKDRGISLNSLM